jgi:putative ABC transport system substrate-binding protein
VGGRPQYPVRHSLGDARRRGGETAIREGTRRATTDLILSAVTPTTAALLEQTRTIPIVFAAVSDPVGSGFVASLAQPGGNVTGFQAMVGSLAGKWLELLKEIAPRVTRVAMLFNPAVAPYAESFLNPFKAAASSFAVEAIAAPVRDLSELESVVAAGHASRMVA